MRGLTRLPIVFLGPSMDLGEAQEILAAEYRPPCRRGDLEGIGTGRIVAIVDGVFHQDQAVAPREVHEAIKRGVTVFGAASMGALRAAEVAGMVGIGRVYEMYVRGLIDSDDEVALLFDSERYRAVTVPLVNVRYAVERLLYGETIDTAVGRAIIKAAERLHYAERTYRRIVEQAGLHQRADAPDLIALLESIDLKKEDARRVLEKVAEVTNGRLAAEASGASSDPLGQAVPTSRRRAGVAWRTDPDAPVGIWESGDAVAFPELLEFLAATNRYVPYAERALTRMLVAHALGDATYDVEPVSGTKDRFRNTCQIWGWRTNEEARVTLGDLGLGLRDALQYLRADALVRGVAMTSQRNAHAAFRAALRAELFFSDLALKRETMVLGSLVQLARATSAPSPRANDHAKRLLCRLHKLNSWAQVQARVSMQGFAEASPDHWADVIARAIDGSGEADAPPRQRDLHALQRADTLFGVEATTRPATERRFSFTAPDAERWAASLSKVVGITRVGFIDRLSTIDGVYVSQAARPNGRWSSTYGSGKSNTRDGAFVGGVMEEVEKWTQEQFVGEPILATYDDLRATNHVLDPRLLDLPYDSEYSATQSIAWQKAYDLINADSISVPLAAVACPFNVPSPNPFFSPRAARALFSTNGLASGFALVDALLHATYEIVERHAAKVSELRVDNPGLTRAREWPRELDLTALPTSLAVLVAHIVEAGYDVRAWDITSEVPIPTVHARLNADGNVSSGWAAHADPVVACHGAILEACQTLISGIAGGREDLTVHARSLGRHERPKPRRSAGDAVWYQHRGPTAPIQTLRGLTTSNTGAEWAWVRTRLVAAGVDVLVAVDLTVPEIAPARVVRVVIPGLETNNPFHCGMRARRVLADDVLLG